MKCDCSSHNGFLTAKGLEETAQRRDDLPGIDAMDESCYIDTMVSVSAVVEVEGLYVDVPASLIDEQHRRFLQLELV